MEVGWFVWVIFIYLFLALLHGGFKENSWLYYIPRQHGKEQHEAWSSFAVPLSDNISSLDAADDTEDCNKASN